MAPEGEAPAGEVPPPVGEIVAVQPGAEEPPSIEAWQHPERAALEALRTFFTKLASLDGDGSTITKAEFAACCANPELGPQISNQDAVFDCLDVDGSGEISLDELLYAVAGRYMANTGPGTKDPAAAWREAITGLSEALAELEASGKKMTGAAFRKAQKSTQKLQAGHSTGVKREQYVAAFLCPCYINCTARGEAVGTVFDPVASQWDRKLVGMEKVMEYVIACKDAPAHYSWCIQNYHMETHTYTTTDSEGNTVTETSEHRVNTHFACTSGELVTWDATSPFQPNLSKANVVLTSVLDTKLDAGFTEKYEHRKQSFYASNTTDTHQDTSASFKLKPMKPALHVAWVETPPPCYVDPCVRCLMSLTPLTAPLWLMLMDSYMGKQKVTYKKRCSDFKEAPSTPRNLRDIAAGKKNLPGGGKADNQISLQLTDYRGRPISRPADVISPKGPTIKYLGSGNWMCKGERDIKGMSHVGMLAGGKGIAPLYQIVREALRDTSDTTKFSLICANRTAYDMISQYYEELNGLAQRHPDRFSVHYTLDRPGPDWEGSTGFITAEMISAHLPPPSASTLIVMCGPPPMIKFACKQNLDALGYDKKRQLAF